jgi:sodium transport system permease protein
LDSASTSQKQAFVWSKILPMILLVWALTGAFYPAVDLCAGEKERGTLETLLISPASRRELVWGKLLTVMSFSVVTALLNLMSMMVTTSFVFQHFSHTAQGSTLGSLGPISPELVVWLVLLVLPMSAMFSALAMAVASLARSTKEGQYYLMPLMLVGFPLVMLSVLPGMTLSAGTSMIPITGAILLSRSLMDGEYGSAMIYLPSVLSMTALCCLLAIRWAVRQFENESVLFSEVDKTNFKHWFVRIWLQRTTHPSATESLVGGLAILVALFFGRLAMGTTRMEWRPVAISTFVIQVGILLGPTLIMAIILTRSVNKALRWNLPRWDDLLVCSLLAVAFHPTYVRIAEIVHRAYPVGPETLEALRQFDGLLATVPLWAVLAIFALLPALCEELAFRGFVFAGLLENKGVLRAIVGSSLLFGMSHGVLQQSICATLMGLVLGWLAYRTGGIACTFAFHFLHNAISMTLASSGARGQGVPPWLAWALDGQGGAILYTPFWTHVSLAVSLVLLVWISVRVARPERHRYLAGWSATSQRSLAANTDLGS